MAVEMKRDVRQMGTWERALRRAIARGVKVKRVEVRSEGAARIERWLATSASRAGVRHSVMIYAGPGRLDVSCTCEGGQHGRVCQHAAGVLRTAGYLPSLLDTAAWDALAAEEQAAAPMPQQPPVDIEALKRERAKLLLKRMQADTVDSFDELDQINDAIRAIDAQLARVA